MYINNIYIHNIYFYKEEACLFAHCESELRAQDLDEL
jgi:hypothetical protein